MPAVTCAVLHWFLCLLVGDHCIWLLRVTRKTQPILAHNVIDSANKYVRVMHAWSVAINKTLCAGTAGKHWERSRPTSSLKPRVLALPSQTRNMKPLRAATTKFQPLGMPQC
jgi:hypothetical protein